METYFRTVVIRLQDDAVLEITLRFDYDDPEEPVLIVSAKLNGQEQW